jgi:hypothetical protein
VDFSARWLTVCSRLFIDWATSIEGAVVSIPEIPPTPPSCGSGRLFSSPAIIPSFVTVFWSASTLAWSLAAFCS